MMANKDYYNDPQYSTAIHDCSGTEAYENFENAINSWF